MSYHRYLSTTSFAIACLLCNATHAQTTPANPSAAVVSESGSAAPLTVPAPISAAAEEKAITIDAAPVIKIEPTATREQLPVLRGDMWGRIRNNFGMSDLSDEWVQKQEQWYGSRPEYITRMTERSRKYMYHIVEELERRKMPSELALLPFIESAFNPQAMSSAKAAGMWQFIDRKSVV